MRAYIIQKALNMFSRYGAKAVTMDDIADQIGISKRTLYELFNSKEAILMECIKIKIKSPKFNIDARANLLDLLMDLYNQVDRTQQIVTYQFFYDLHKYYNNSYQMLIDHISDYAVAAKARVGESIMQGYIQRNISSQFVYDFVVKHLSQSFFDNEMRLCILPNNEYMSQNIIVFMRGISTPKGLEYIDNLLITNRINENH